MLKETLNKRISTSVAMGIILILVILVGGFTWIQYEEIREEAELSEIELPEKEESKAEKGSEEIIKEKDVANWQTFSLEKYGFSIKFPPEYEEERKIVHSLEPIEGKITTIVFKLADDERLLIDVQESSDVKKTFTSMTLGYLEIIRQSDNPTDDLEKDELFSFIYLEQGRDDLISVEEIERGHCNGINYKIFKSSYKAYRQTLDLCSSKFEELYISIWFSYKNKDIEPEILKMINTIECN